MSIMLNINLQRLLPYMALAGAIFLALISLPVHAQNASVGITPDMFSFKATVGGKAIEIKRNQDTKNRLINSFTKTSRPCPPFCIHPMKAAPGVETVGEIELIDFLKTHVEPGTGLLIDARLSQFYNKGSIPGAVNIPFNLFSPKENPYIDKIRLVLGGVKTSNGDWNYDNALSLMLFCNGPWCDQSPRAIKNLIAAGYPPQKLFYYRGGMQNWQAMGLNITRPQS